MSPIPDESQHAERGPVGRLAWWSAIPLVAWIVIALSTIGVIGGVAFAVTAGQPEPAVGLYWTSNADPTAGGGVSAPLWQLLWRTDQPSVYYKSGTANTAWTKVGSGTASGGTVTSIACGAGVSCSPASPITTSGTISFGSTGTIGDLSAWTGASTLGNFAGSTGTGCTAGNVTTNVAISAAGAITNTCTAIGTAGGLTGTLTAGKIPVAASPTSLTDGSWSDTGSALSTSSTVAVNAQFTTANQILRTGIITPTALNTTTNNYNPTGLSGASIIIQSATAATAITGLVAQPTGTVVTIVVPTTSTFPITLSNLNGGSSAANQFRLPGSTTWTIDIGYSATLRYTGSDWQLLDSVAATIPGLTVNGITNLAQLRYSQPQTFSTTGTSNSVVINSTTTIFQYTGSGTATITGFLSNTPNRLLIVYNTTSNALTLANLNGGSLSTQQIQNVGNTDAVLNGPGSSATYVYDTTTNGPWRMIGFTTTTRGDAVSFTNTKNAGTITLSGGTGTATVNSGAHCTCSDSTANASVQCAVSTTTLTATGTGTDVITYLCF